MPADESTWKQFADKLDAHHQWPCAFVFKCVVPVAAVESARALLPEGQTSARESQGGKYTSLTCVFHAESADAVVIVYRRLSEVAGIILL